MGPRLSLLFLYESHEDWFTMFEDYEGGKMLWNASYKTFNIGFFFSNKDVF